MKPSRIGVFDSGLGGLFVLKELKSKFFDSTFYYYGDTINMPFGNKSKADIKNITLNIINALNKLNLDLIICACGTISSQVFDEVKMFSKCPIINVLDYTVDYINELYDNVLVLSTVGTAKSMYFQNRFNNNIEVLGLKDLASLIENNLPYESYLNELLPNKSYDAIVLGCTHFPAIKDYLSKKYKCDIVDMGKVISNGINLSKADGKVYLYFSKYRESEKNNINKFIDFDYEIIDIL